jgi:hypothetical protein
LALDALEQSQIRFSLLHDEDRILSHSIQSDVDIVVGSSPRTILARSLNALHAINLHPIVINAYDAGGSASVYMATERAMDGLQLDMYFDPRAVGRLGLRTDALLANSVRGARWRVVAPEYQAVYLLRKRQWKGEKRKVDLIRQELLSFDPERMQQAIESSVDKDVAASVHRLLQDDWHSFKTPIRNPLADRYRWVNRLRHPVGFWTDIIGVDSERVAKDLARRFDRILVTRAGPRPAQPASMARWLVRDVAPLRWKPGLFVSWSPRMPRTARANLELTDVTTTNEALARRVVMAMEARLRLAQPVGRR